MYKKILIAGFVLMAFISHSADVITLNNQMSFSGEVKSIKKCTVRFKTAGEIYDIPADDIFTVQFENPDSRILKNYQELNDADKCLKARTDADMYHGKAGLHIALGVLFGPFAIIGAAVGNPTPEKGNDTFIMSKNKEVFSDPAYITCYKKKAKGKNVGNTAIGWGSWMVLLLLLGI